VAYGLLRPRWSEFLLGKESASGVESDGIFLTADRNAAQGYGSNVKKAAINLENPVTLDFDGKSTYFFDGKWRTPSDLSKRLREINDDLANRYELSDELVEELDELGWSTLSADRIDGAIMDNIDDVASIGDEKRITTNYLVLDPSNIRIVE